MPFNFAYVCDLFEELEANRGKKAATTSSVTDPDRMTVDHWFRKHLRYIYGGDADNLGLLSSTCPEKRNDPVFPLKEASLVRTVGKCLL